VRKRPGFRGLFGSLAGLMLGCIIKKQRRQLNLIIYVGQWRQGEEKG